MKTECAANSARLRSLRSTSLRDTVAPQLVGSRRHLRPHSSYIPSFNGKRSRSPAISHVIENSCDLVIVELSTIGWHTWSGRLALRAHAARTSKQYSDHCCRVF
jgi:hypothetical protein